MTIVCSLQGKPMPVIRWFKEGKKIRIDGMKYQAQGDELYIKSTTEADGGIYGCVGENMAGRNTASSILIVGGNIVIIHMLMNEFVQWSVLNILGQKGNHLRTAYTQKSTRIGMMCYVKTRGNEP